MVFTGRVEKGYSLRVRGVGAGVARLFWEQEVGGSIPPTPTTSHAGFSGERRGTQRI